MATYLGYTPFLDFADGDEIWDMVACKEMGWAGG